MDSTELYESILGIVHPWHVVDTITHKKSKDGPYVEVIIDSGEILHCPVCGSECPRHDSRTRRWRHLNSCEYRTILVADIPRVRCPTHGVKQVAIPWAAGRAPYTSKFESWVIELLNESSILGTSRLTGLKWDAIDGIMERGVERGHARRQLDPPINIGVDETSFKKRHDYVTVVMDQETGHAVHVSEGKDGTSLGEYYETLNEKELLSIETVSMDMSPAYISSTKNHLIQFESAICFDRFHVMGIFNDAIGKIRARESKELVAEGDNSLVGTKFDWLSNDKNIDGRSRKWFNELTRKSLITARAWSLKEIANGLWDYTAAGWAMRAWKNLTGRLDRCKIPEMLKVSETIKRHLWGIINAILHGVTNGPSESMNARIQKIKARACGYRNKRRFINAIYFYLGGLDMRHESEMA